MTTTPTKVPNILFMDIENLMRPEHIFHPGKRGKFGGRAAGFCADLSYILVFGYKWLGQPAQSIQLTKKQMKADPFDDTPILMQAYDIMSQAEVVVTWYGEGHDFHFLNTRLARIGKYLDYRMKHIDLYKVANRSLRLSSNRLDNVAAYFGEDRKMKISKTLWPDCWAGNHDSLMKMAEYCRQDCDVLAAVYDHMVNLKTGLPHMGHMKGLDPKKTCEVCGGDKLWSKGYRWTTTGKYQRLQCQACGNHQKGEKL